MFKPLIGAIATLVVAASAQAAVITPVAAEASSTFNNGFYNAENLIDGSGLTDGQHDSNFANMWMTDLGESKAQVTFDLGGLFELASADIWQFNFGTNTPVISTLDRGVKDFRILISLDGTSFAEIFTGSLERSIDGSPIAAQTIALSGLARYVQLDILSNYTYGTIYEPYEASGLSEVRFNSVDVPEPAGLALLAAGIGAVGLSRRRVRANRMA